MTEKSKLPILVADIGGTHARFALTQPGAAKPDDPAIFMTALFPTLGDALSTFLEQAGLGQAGLGQAELGQAELGQTTRAQLAGVAMCAAGPLEQDTAGTRIAMTNCPWTLDQAEIAAATGYGAPILVNDFTAAAMAVPHLTTEATVQIGGTGVDENAPKAIIGPGTGLGVSGLVRDSLGDFISLSGEGGHVSLSPGNEREISLLFQLMQVHGHVSAERVLSGPGMEELFGALGALDGSPETGRPTAADIARMAQDGSSPLARETIDVFTGLLGSVAGDLALTLGARGGVYLAGGILPRWGDMLNQRLLRYRFEAKGRFKNYLAEIPIFLITQPDIALIGLTALARKSTHPGDI